MTFVTSDRKWGFSRGSCKTLPQRGSRRREADGGRAGSAISGSGRTACARGSGAGPDEQGSGGRAELEREDGEELPGPRVRQAQRPHANGGRIDLRRVARKMNVESAASLRARIEMPRMGSRFQNLVAAEVTRLKHSEDQSLLTSAATRQREFSNRLLTVVVLIKDTLFAFQATGRMVLRGRDSEHDSISSVIPHIFTSFSLIFINSNGAASCVLALMAL